MAAVNVQPRQGSGLGAKIGGLAGLVAGAVAAPFTGGASLATIPGAAAAAGLSATGGAIGGMIGGATDNHGSGNVALPTSSGNPLERRMAMNAPQEDPLHVLHNGFEALAQISPAEQRQYTPTLLQAYMKQLNGGTV